MWDTLQQQPLSDSVRKFWYATYAGQFYSVLRDFVQIISDFVKLIGPGLLCLKFYLLCFQN